MPGPVDVGICGVVQHVIIMYIGIIMVMVLNLSRRIYIMIVVTPIIALRSVFIGSPVTTHTTGSMYPGISLPVGTARIVRCSDTHWFATVLNRPRPFGR